jgi:hypothetical protein
MSSITFTPVALACFTELLQTLTVNSIVEIKLKYNKITFSVGIKNVQLEKTLLAAYKEYAKKFDAFDVEFIDANDGVSMTGVTPTSFIKITYKNHKAIKHSSFYLKDFTFRLHYYTAIKGCVQEYLKCLDAYLTLTTNEHWHAIGVTTE